MIMTNHHMMKKQWTYNLMCNWDIL